MFHRLDYCNSRGKSRSNVSTGRLFDESGPVETVLHVETFGKHDPWKRLPGPYPWKRFLAPQNVSPFRVSAFCIVHRQNVSTGRRSETFPRVVFSKRFDVTVETFSRKMRFRPVSMYPSKRFPALRHVETFPLPRTFPRVGARDTSKRFFTDCRPPETGRKSATRRNVGQIGDPWKRLEEFCDPNRAHSVRIRFDGSLLATRGNVLPSENVSTCRRSRNVSTSRWHPTRRNVRGAPSGRATLGGLRGRP